MDGKKVFRMENIKHAVYPATFGPYTIGHDRILYQAANVFDKITLAIGYNPEKDKNAMFSIDERLSMLQQVVINNKTDCEFEIGSFANKFLVKYAESIDAKFIIRGLRSISDFDYEFGMAYINKTLNPKIKTVIFFADPEFSSISSSLVRGMIGLENWKEVVSPYIPACMLKTFLEIISNKI